ncbi:MAG: DUF853 family protein [Clostridia bacterium]|nr:DUF853 family protein [Clostridia bacterium]
MFNEEKIWIANNTAGEKVFILPGMVNRHGLVTGATGTGKTVTLKVMAESFSDMGVPVFMADVKGDIAGMCAPGRDSEDMQARIQRFGLNEAGFSFHGYPVTLWDIFGRNGIQLRTTISEMGPLLLARILGLNDLQSDILSVVFKIADDNNLLLVDTKDLKAMLAYVDSHSADFQADYGKISSASVGVITRALVALETAGGDVFFGEPALNITDWLSTGSGGKGMINILDSSSLINNGRLYSAFLLWLLSELFEVLPEVGDLAKPKLVFFFDEAHLLFNDISRALLEKVEMMVKLIRSKGVGVYFCTQNPRDIPDGVLAQLGNKVQHGLRAYTPADQRSVRAAADSFRINPAFNTYDTILNLGTGEAVVSFLDAKGIPGMAEKVFILPPQCSMAAISYEDRDRIIKESLLYSKYFNPVDPESAYEFLIRMAVDEEKAMEAIEAEKKAQAEAERAEKEAQKAAEKAEKEAQKAAEKEAKEAQKAAEKEAKAAEKEAAKRKNARKSAAKAVGNSVVGTVGREVGKSLGGKFGKFGKTLGGNLGASLGRGILSTLFKK